MKKTLPFVLLLAMMVICAMCFSSCTKELKPYEIIYEGHRISLWMTREEIEGMLGEGTERKSQIDSSDIDVVVYRKNLEIFYVGWSDNHAEQFADGFFFNNPIVHSCQDIKVGDDIGTIPIKYKFATKGGGEYRVYFLQGENIDGGTYITHDVAIFYHNGDDGRIESAEIRSRVYTPFWRQVGD